MCLLLSSPDRLPHSIHCVILSIIAYFLIGLWLLANQYSSFEIFSLTLLELGLLAAITYTSLTMRKRAVRFQQTYSALIGVSLWMSIVSIPLHLSIEGDGGDSDNLLRLLLLITIVWTLAALSLVFKRALEISTHVSAMISFNYFIVFQLIVYWFYL